MGWSKRRRIVRRTIGAMAVLGLTLSGLGCGSAPPTPSASTTTVVVPHLVDQPFTSAVHGYSLRLADRWQAEAASGPWLIEPGVAYPRSRPYEGVDFFWASASERVWATSTVIPAGKDLEDWLATYLPTRRWDPDGTCLAPDGKLVQGLQGETWAQRTVAGLTLMERDSCS